MKEQAVAKLNAEMEGNKNNPYIRLTGDFLLHHLGQNPQDAEKILVADKTISKSLDAMQTEARKKQHNGMAMLTDAEGFAIVLKYFDIKGAVVLPAAPAAVTVTAAPAPSRKAASDFFDVSLSDFGL